MKSQWCASTRPADVCAAGAKPVQRPHHPNVAAVARALVGVSAGWSPIGAVASMRMALIFNNEWVGPEAESNRCTRICSTVRR
jgi:hypothetical protein